jgi:hypothetical protein
MYRQHKDYNTLRGFFTEITAHVTMILEENFANNTALGSAPEGEDGDRFHAHLVFINYLHVFDHCMIEYFSEVEEGVMSVPTRKSYEAVKLFEILLQHTTLFAKCAARCDVSCGKDGDSACDKCKEECFDRVYGSTHRYDYMYELIMKVIKTAATNPETMKQRNFDFIDSEDGTSRIDFSRYFHHDGEYEFNDNMHLSNLMDILGALSEMAKEKVVAEEKVAAIEDVASYGVGLHGDDVQSESIRSGRSGRSSRSGSLSSKIASSVRSVRSALGSIKGAKQIRETGMGGSGSGGSRIAIAGAVALMSVLMQVL